MKRRHVSMLSGAAVAAVALGMVSAPAQAKPAPVLAKEPNRYRATSGAARAARQAGNAAKAKLHFAALVGLGRNADTQRDSLVEARQFLARK